MLGWRRLYYLADAMHGNYAKLIRAAVNTNTNTVSNSTLLSSPPPSPDNQSDALQASAEVACSIVNSNRLVARSVALFALRAARVAVVRPIVAWMESWHVGGGIGRRIRRRNGR